MCGIAGLVLGDGGVAGAREEAIVQRMLDTLTHRGGDGRRIAQLGPACFGYERLALTRPNAPPDQPQVSRGGETLSVINGTLHNLSELGLARQGRGAEGSDCAALAEGIADRGVHCLEQLEGPFALAHYDHSQRTLHLARDLFGRKPLFFAQLGREIYFASSPKALLSIGVSTALDPAAVAELLRNGWCIPPRTLHKAIRQVAPGEVLSVRGSEQTSRSLPWPEPRRDGESLLHHLHRAMERRLATLQRPAAVLLSGGLDSAAVLCAAREHALPAFTWKTESATLDESSDAQLTAKALGVSLQVVTGLGDPFQALKALTDLSAEPITDPSTLQLSALAHATGTHATVLFSGDGGDELLVGYRRHRLAKLALGAARFMPRHALRALAHCLPDSRNKTALFALASGSHALQHLAQLAPDLALSAVLEPGWLQEPSPIAVRFEQLCTTLGPARAAARTDLELGLRHGLMLKADRAAMASGREIWSPFLDREVVAWAWAQHERELLRGSQGKWSLRQELAKHLPKRITAAKKRGFATPLATWLRSDEVQESARALLSQEAHIFSGVLRVDASELLRCARSPALQPVVWSALAIALAAQTAKESARPASSL
jgi:asparagine synthase (glutamine-hydrolysing)